MGLESAFCALISVRQVASFAAIDATRAGSAWERFVDSLGSFARLNSSFRPFSKFSSSFQSPSRICAAGSSALIAIMRIVPVEGPRREWLILLQEPSERNAIGRIFIGDSNECF